MQILSNKQLIDTLKELYNLINVTSGFKYKGLMLKTHTESYIVIFTDTGNPLRVCRLIAYYGSLKCQIVCRLPVTPPAAMCSENTLNRFNTFIDFLKSIPCIKVTPDEYLNHTYYIQLEDL